MTTTVAQALAHAARLIPTRAAGSSQLTGHPVYVLTDPGELPDGHNFRTGQAARRMLYFQTGQRVPSGDMAAQAPRYIVTSYGVPIAWVTMDGRAHYAHGDAVGVDAHGLTRARTMWRHRNVIMARWPERFVLDSMGDPQTRLYPDGVRRMLTA